MPTDRCGLRVSRGVCCQGEVSLSFDSELLPTPTSRFELGWKLSSIQKQTNIIIFLCLLKKCSDSKWSSFWEPRFSPPRILSRPSKDKNQGKTRSQVQI